MHVRVYRASGQQVTTLLTPPSPPSSARRLAPSASGAVREASEGMRERLQTTNSQLKGGLLPIIDLAPGELRSLEGEASRGRPDRWRLLFANRTDARAVSELCAPTARRSPTLRAHARAERPARSPALHADCMMIA